MFEDWRQHNSQSVPIATAAVQSLLTVIENSKGALSPGCVFDMWMCMYLHSQVSVCLLIARKGMLSVCFVCVQVSLSVFSRPVSLYASS